MTCAMMGKRTGLRFSEVEHRLLGTYVVRVLHQSHNGNKGPLPSHALTLAVVRTYTYTYHLPRNEQHRWSLNLHLRAPALNNTYVT